MKLFRDPRTAQVALAGACAGLVAWLLGGCSQKPAPDVVAKVGSRDIRVSDLQREAERRRALHRAAPDKEVLLQEMIQQEALVQRARRAGLDKDPQLVREMENLLVGRLLDRELAQRIEAVTVSPEEIRANYEVNLAKYTQPAKSRLAILFLETGTKSSEAKRAETRERLAEARRKFLENPEAARRTSPVPGFGALALNYSDDQASRYRSGDLGWFEAGARAQRFPAVVLEAGCALATNQLSEIIETGAGFYLVLKTDARPAAVTPLEKVEADLRQSVLLKKRRELDAAFRQEAVALAGVTRHTNALAAVELPPPAPTLARNGDAGPPAFPMPKEPSPASPAPALPSNQKSNSP
jgi:parvulin-like peptidyl-prolyl isomerase